MDCLIVYLFFPVLTFLLEVMEWQLRNILSKIMSHAMEESLACSYLDMFSELGLTVYSYDLRLGSLSQDCHEFDIVNLSMNYFTSTLLGQIIPVIILKVSSFLPF